MAKRSGSKSSRSERRAGRKRADRAREHGLPTRRDAPPRSRASTPEPRSGGEAEARSTDSPRERAAKSAGIPTLVKVVGGALVVLVGVYLVTLLRDESPKDSGPAAATPATSAVAEPEVRPEPPAALPPPAPAIPSAPAPVDEPPAAAPVAAPVLPPKKVLALTPAASASASPKLEKPSVVATKAVPATAAPKPAVPKPAPVAPAAPADNPY